MGRVLDYGDDAALADASAVAKPFARAASYAQKHRLLGVVPPGLREDARARCFHKSARRRGGGRARGASRGLIWGRPPLTKVRPLGRGVWWRPLGLWRARRGRYHSDVWRFDVTTTAWRLMDVAGPRRRCRGACGNHAGSVVER